MLISDHSLNEHSQVYPNNGLDVSISGSGASGKPPTTLSPTMLIIDWRCITSVLPIMLISFGV